MKTHLWKKWVFRGALLLGLLAASIPMQTVRAASIVVNSNADITANDGQCTLREAITNANNDAATWVDCAAGTGVDTITFSGAMTITLTLALPNITDVDLLTINGGSSVVVSGNNAVRIVTVNAAANAAWQNITLQDGAVNGNGGAIVNNGNLTITNVTFTNNRTITTAGNDGGAVYQAAGTLTVTNSAFNGNYTQDNGGAIDIIAGTATITGTTFLNNNNAATDDGGALYVTAGTATVSTSSFTGNQSVATGGAVRVAGGTISISGSTFTNNSVTSVTASNGGAIYLTVGTLTVTNSTFTNNSATAGDGGAIYHNAATLLTVTNSTFSGNRANFAFLDGDGGAIAMASATAGSSANISGSTFSSNLANDDGGALSLASEPVTITNSIFSSNQTLGVNGTSEGGAIYLTNAADSTSIRLSTFTNNTISSTANVTVRGGAISNAGTAFILANDTFSGNSITKTGAAGGNAQGGAIWITGAAAETTTIHNVTFSGNSAFESGTGTADGGSLFRNAGVTSVANTILTNSTENAATGNCGGTITNGGNNIAFSGADCGFPAASNVNPLLGALTGSPSYFPLNPVSPAIDTGSNATCATAATTNNQSQNGIIRPVDGNSDATATCDMGSYELPDASPIVLSSVRVNPSPTNLASVDFTVTFSESVSGTATSNFSLTTTSAVSGASVTSVSGSGTTYTITVNTGTGDGTLRLDMTNSAGVTDGSGNAVIGLPYTGGQVYTIDKTGPTVTINQAIGQADPTNVSPINFTVVFSEAVVGFDATDIALSGTGNPTTAVISGGPTTYNVAVSGMTSGTVIANVKAGAVTDAIGNASSASTSADNIVGFDITNPSVVSIVRANPDPTNAGSVNFTITFNESMTGGATSNFNIVTSGVSGASITGISGSGFTRTVTVNTGSGNGTIRLDMVNSIGVTDGVSNTVASLPFAGETYTIDRTGPTVTINQAIAQNDPTNTSPINFTVTFSEAVSGFINTDVTPAGTAGATTVVVSGGPTIYNVAVSGMTISGTVSATVNAGAVTDALGNPSSASTSADNIVIYDITQPGATSIVRADTDPTNAASVDFTVTFSESVTGVDTADFNLTTAGVAGASIASISGSGAGYTITVNTGANSGTIRLNLISNGTIRDLSNNGLSGPRIGDEFYTIDKTRPSVTINQAIGQLDPTNVSPINFTATFSEPVSGFDGTGVTLGGTAGASIAVVTEIAPNDGTTYTVAVSGMAGDGTIIASVDPNSAQDSVGNDNFTSTSTDNTVTYDTTAPNTSITGNPSNPSNDDTPTFTFTGNDGTGSGINGFECQINAGGWSACASGVTFGPFADGVYTFDVRAIDNAGNLDTTPASYTWTIDANQAPTVNAATFSVNENSANGTAVGTVTYSDPLDTGQTYICSIQSGNTGGAFLINPSTCAITVNTSGVLNFEVNPTFNLIVRVTDNGMPILYGEAAITINLNNVNEAPVVNAATFTIAENSPNATSVGTVTYTEPDGGGQLHTCSIQSGNTGGAFAINISTCAITVNTSGALDYEINPTFSLVVRVTDNGIPIQFGEALITINLINTNENPTNIALSNNTINENQPINTVVGTLTATDPDAGATFTFNLTCAVAGANDSSFNISGTNLQTSAAFDYETQSVYNICIRVTDQGGLTFDRNFVINIGNVNEGPINIALSNNNVNENQPINTIIGILTATDPDAGATFTFSLTCATAGVNDGSFNVNGTNLRTSASFDYETQNTYNICIRVTDQGGLTFDRNFTINVNNVNETPTNINLTASTVAENQPVGTNIGSLSSVDPDTGDTFTYTLVNGGVSCPGTDNASFAISGASLQSAVVFDYETKNSYNICIRTTDSGGLTFDKQFTIAVTNVNEAPTDIALSNNTVNENQPANVIIGALSAADPDAGATFTFSLTCTVAGADDSSFNISGSNLRTSASFNYETKNSYSICVRVTDQGTLTFDKNFTITINNVNEAPTNISLSNNSVNENQAINTVAGSLTATDPDAGATFTFSLSCSLAGADDLSFNINGTNLRTSASFDYETKNTYNICVRVADQGGLTFDKNFVININNVNEAPTNINLLPSSVAENQPSGTNMGTLTSVDPDVGDTFTYTLVNGGVSCLGTDNVSFTISSSTFQTAAIFNFEIKNSYVICVRTTDSGGLTFDKQFTIAVTNVNEAPTNINLAASIIAENLASGTAIGALSSADPDTGDTFTYTLVNGGITCPGTDNASFSISSAALQSAAVFDYETKSSYVVCIRTTDSGGLTFDKQFTITVLNANEAPVNISLSNNTINENQPVSTGIGAFSTTDPDTGDTHAYTLVNTLACPGLDAASFQISGANLQSNVIFDFEIRSIYTICVRTTDSGGLPFDKQFMILVNNINDAPIFTSTPVIAAGENILYTYNVTAKDQDNNPISFFAGITVPAWLILTDNGNGTATLTGTPGAINTGANAIVIEASDGSITTQQAFTITVTNTPPKIVTNGINTNADTGDHTLSELEVATVGINQFIVTFDQDVLNPPGNGGIDDVTNPANYMLVFDNGDGFQTTTCAMGVHAQDMAIISNSVTYSNNAGVGPYIATVNVNNGNILSPGAYRFYVCGTTSITDISDPTLQLAGDGTNEGTDFIRNFIIAASTNASINNEGTPANNVRVPATGFPQGEITTLPIQPVDLKYDSYSGLWLEIPKLNISIDIVGVPLKNDSWDVSWLGKDAGWLNGTAFPTLKGNSVITAHVWDAYNNPGPFADIKNLQYGDSFIIHAFGQSYTYEVRESRRISPSNTNSIFKHEDKAWVTLLTCEQYQSAGKTYSYRRMVQAVLISISAEK